MNRTHFSIAAALIAFALPAAGQNTPPVVTTPIADFTEYAGAAQRSIDLTTAFADSDVSAAVRLTTVLGNIDIALLGPRAPLTVANFLNYVDQGRYFLTDQVTHQQASSFVHRSVQPPSSSISVIQGGGFIGTVNSANTAIQPTSVLTLPTVPNEFQISNTRGTIAMAKIGGQPNSATSQWFINTTDNLSLNTSNGGFTVFGRIVNNTMTVADAIAAVTRYNFSAVGPDFMDLPLRNYNGTSPVQVSNLVSIPAIARIPTLTFSVTSNNATVADATVSGTHLLVAGHQVGSAMLTVTATDFDGATVSQSFTVNVVAAPGRLVQLSTRMQVGTGDNVLIGGFIMRGPSPKRLMIRAIGPSTGLEGALTDPVLELHDATGATIATNNNWGDAANRQDIVDSGVAPVSPDESAILTTLPSGSNAASYTAIVSGANNSTGIALVEVYDLDSGPGSTLLNIATRGRVNVDPDALIGGFFLGGTESKRVLVRAIGPSLAPFGIPGTLADPTLELHDGNGALLESNDDWGTSPNQAEIQASGVAPTNPKESAVLRILPAGPFTAIVRGVNNTAGVASVEIYQLP